ncbi:T9SS type A sorting domain-containing protein [Flavobacterium psychrotolerans]|uniref:Secretion system C-terminal sorting domain-containing protein n=1 Tax=Flavobacterium psychrotolerans TaxID=2169410 RepID=A0A2U1JG64_9FLAO|nr:T9SS type A sorting domain-containing protein [Flavobacterium psychrotolerans]PWA03974.1 hypothetical protein DB895_13355 [Flavobacterium psychrotolerans]
MKTKLHYLIIALLFGFGMSAQTISITGTGTGGWNQPGGVLLTSTDGENYTASNFEIVGDGEMKFSEGDWGTTGGNVAQPGFPSGTVIVNGGMNIKGTLGFWSVTYNIITKNYSFTPGVNPNAVIKINGGGLAADAQMQTNNGIAYSKKSTTFAGGDAKFIQEGTANEWGGAFPDGPVVSGASIPVPAGTFNVYFFKTDPVEYLFEPTVVSMIGNFVGSGWGADIDFETTDNVIFTKTAYVFTPNAPDLVVHMKIRDNHDWTYQFGVPVKDVSATSGTLINVNAQDMTLPAGTYNVTFNRSTYEYSFVDALATKGFASSNFKVYPNPTTNNWNFASNNNTQINSIRIVDVLGKVVLTKNATSNSVSIDASNLSNGVYFAKVTTDVATETVKLVKN